MPMATPLTTATATSSSPRTHRGVPGTTSTTEMISGSRNSTSVCPACDRSAGCAATRSRFSETATNSSPVSAPLALPAIVAKSLHTPPR